MANKQFNDLPAAISLNDTDLYAVQQGTGAGGLKKATSSQVQAKFGVNILSLLGITGKKVYCMGDSFTATNIYQAILVSMGLTVTSDGVSGCCITGGTANAVGDGTSRPPIVDRYAAALATNPDILIIQGGSNDWVLQIALGSLSTLGNRNTYYGALHELFAACAAKGIRVIPITLTQRNSTYYPSGGTAGRVNYLTQETYANAMVEVARLYGIAVADAFHGSGLTFENANITTIDGVHPATAIGQAIYQRFIASAILSFTGVSNVTSLTTG